MSLPNSKSVEFIDRFSGQKFTLCGSSADQSVIGPIETGGGTWEPHLVSLFHRLIRPHDVCLDIGANVGVHSLVMADLAHDGHVYAFEPSSMNFAYLKQNLASNRITNVTACQLGLSNVVGKRAFHTLIDIPGASFASDPGTTRSIERAIEDGLGYKFPYTSETVEFSTLDEWLARYRVETVRLVKMDVEGSEDFVVRGGETFLNRAKPFLVAELNTKSLIHYFGIEPRIYFDRLSNIYNHIYMIGEAGELVLVHDFEEVANFLSETKYWADIVCSAVELAPEPYLPPQGLMIELASAIAPCARDSAPGPEMAQQAVPEPNRRQADRIKALYFTVVPLALLTNGGTMCCRNHVEQLSLDPEVDLTVVTAGPDEWAESHRGFVQALGSDHIHLAFEYSPTEKPKLRDELLFPQEKWAYEYSNLDERLVAVVTDLLPDVIVVDYLPSTVYVRSIFDLPIPRVVVTLNREAEFFREQRKSGQIAGRWYYLLIANIRFWLWERWIHEHCHGIVALSRNDLPTGLPDSIVLDDMAPTFRRSHARWSYKGNKDIFFVGNTIHYPNRMAMEWICTKLAPHMEALDPEVRFRLIGAAEADVPESWRRPSIEFLGVADDKEVTRRFTDSAVFVAPIANNFGSKMKLLECLSHGTPFVATVPAMSGLPFLNELDTIDLQQPKQAALTIYELLRNPEKLEALSRRNDALTAEFQGNRYGAWGRLLHRVLSSVRAPRVRPGWRLRVEQAISEMLAAIFRVDFGDKQARW